MHRILSKFFFTFYFTIFFNQIFRLVLIFLSKFYKNTEVKVKNDQSRKGTNEEISYLQEHIDFTTKRINNYPHHKSIFNLLNFLGNNHDKFGNLNNKKILSLGPRNIIELFLIYLSGFKWKNIHGMDVISSNPKIKVGDFSKNFPFNDNEFDFVICSHSISKSFDQKKTASEIKRILKPNSYLVIADNDTVDWHASHPKKDTLPPYLCNGFTNQYESILELYCNSNWQNLTHQKKINENTFEAIVKVTN